MAGQYYFTSYATTEFLQNVGTYTVLVFASKPISAVFFFSSRPSYNFSFEPSALIYQITPAQHETRKSLPLTFSMPSVPPSMPSAIFVSDLSFSTLYAVPA